MPSPENSSRFIEGYKKLNKFTFVGFLGVAAAGALFAPSIVAPALTLVVIDGVQIIALNAWQNRKKNSTS